MNTAIAAFVRESNYIEGIHRDPSEQEVEATARFLDLEKLTIEDVYALQAVYAPGKPVRDRIGMNVRVGNLWHQWAGGISKLS